MAVPARPLSDLVHPTWVPALEPVADTVTAMGEFLRAEVAAGRGYLPAGDPLRAELESLFPPYPGLNDPNRLAGGYPLAGNIR